MLRIQLIHRDIFTRLNLVFLYLYTPFAGLIVPISKHSFRACSIFRGFRSLNIVLCMIHFVVITKLRIIKCTYLSEISHLLFMCKLSITMSYQGYEFDDFICGFNLKLQEACNEHEQNVSKW